MLATLYLTAVALMGHAPLKRLAGQFVLSLVPIAIAYHLAHYFSMLAIAGQFIIPLVSDPFGYGWDLFGTTLYRIDIGLVDARFIWYLSVTAIVTGHITRFGSVTRPPMRCSTPAATASTRCSCSWSATPMFVSSPPIVGPLSN